MFPDKFTSPKNLLFHDATIGGCCFPSINPQYRDFSKNIPLKFGFENDCGCFGLLLADTGPSGSIASFTPPPANHHVALLPESVPHLGSGVHQQEPFLHAG